MYMYLPKRKIRCITAVIGSKDWTNTSKIHTLCLDLVNWFWKFLGRYALLISHFVMFLKADKGREPIESKRFWKTHPKNISNTRSTLFNKYGHGQGVTYSITFYAWTDEHFNTRCYWQRIKNCFQYIFKTYNLEF